MSSKPINPLVASTLAGVIAGAFAGYPGAMIGAWATAAVLNKGKGVKKIAIAGAAGTVAGVITTKGLYALNAAAGV